MLIINKDDLKYCHLFPMLLGHPVSYDKACVVYHRFLPTFTIGNLNLKFYKSSLKTLFKKNISKHLVPKINTYTRYFTLGIIKYCTIDGNVEFVHSQPKV